ncbi:hypothetical protein SK128_026977, partial [Halocaridina rubra]
MDGNKIQQQQQQQKQYSNMQTIGKPQAPAIQQNQPRQAFRKLRMPHPINHAGVRPSVAPQPIRGMNQSQMRGPPPTRYNNRPPRPPVNTVPNYGQQHSRPYYPTSQDSSYHQGPPSQHSQPSVHGPTSHGQPPFGLVRPHDHHPPPSDLHRVPSVPSLSRSSHSILNAPRPSAQAILGPPPELPHRPLIDPNEPDPYSSRAPFPSRHTQELDRSYDYGSSHYNDSQRSGWNEYSQISQPYDTYERGDYYRTYGEQGYQDSYRYDSSKEYGERYRDNYYRDSHSYGQYPQSDYQYQQDPTSFSNRGVTSKPPSMDVDRSSHNVQ